MVVFFAVEVHTYILLPSHQESSFMVLLPQILLDLARGNLQKFTRGEPKGYNLFLDTTTVAHGNSVI